MAALDGPQDAVQEMAAEFGRRRRLIADGLASIPGINCPEPEGAFYAFPSIRDTGLTSDGEFENECGPWAGSRRSPPLSGAAFGAFGEGYVRLSYANSQENISRALENLDKMVRAL